LDNSDGAPRIGVVCPRGVDPDRAAFLRLEHRNSIGDSANEVNPSHSDAHAQLGQALLNKGNPQEAIRSATKAVELAPLNILGHQVLIQACRAQGLDEQAARWQASLERFSETEFRSVASRQRLVIKPRLDSPFPPLAFLLWSW
jgi:tetratricopeptide (TPR) repeat protein